MQKSIDISIVVCTYNRANVLERALESLVVQRWPSRLEYEIIVVDDGSTDETAAIVHEANRRTDRPVMYVRESGRGIANARNAGVDAARGEWIAFTDDDQIAESAWLLNLWRAQERSSALCIGGARTLELPEETIRALPLSTRLILGEIRPSGDLHSCTRYALLCTGNLLVRKSVVMELGGFDVSLTQGGEDTDLLMRLRRAGYACWFTPHAVVRHIIPGYRLEEAYLTWAAKRGGDCFAVRDIREWGVVRPCFMAVARLGQAATVLLPAMWYARLLGRDAVATACKCRVVRAAAYASRVAALSVSASRGGTTSAANAIEFRGERRMFDQPAG